MDGQTHLHNNNNVQYYCSSVPYEAPVNAAFSTEIILHRNDLYKLIMKYTRVSM